MFTFDFCNFFETFLKVSQKFAISNGTSLCNENVTTCNLRACVLRTCLRESSRSSRIKVIVQWGQFNLLGEHSEFSDVSKWNSKWISKFQKRFTSIFEEQETHGMSSQPALTQLTIEQVQIQNSKHLLKGVFSKFWIVKFTCLVTKMGIQLMELSNIPFSYRLQINKTDRDWDKNRETKDLILIVTKTEKRHPLWPKSVCQILVWLSLVFHGPLKGLHGPE